MSSVRVRESPGERCAVAKGAAPADSGAPRSIRGKHLSEAEGTYPKSGYESQKAAMAPFNAHGVCARAMTV
jgi:hypothetical protein